MSSHQKASGISGRWILMAFQGFDLTLYRSSWLSFKLNTPCHMSTLRIPLARPKNVAVTQGSTPLPADTARRRRRQRSWGRLGCCDTRIDASTPGPCFSLSPMLNWKPRRIGERWDDSFFWLSETLFTPNKAIEDSDPLYYRCCWHKIHRSFPSFSQAFPQGRRHLHYMTWSQYCSIEFDGKSSILLYRISQEISLLIFLKEKLKVKKISSSKKVI